jgi:hypothetical protein
MKHTFYTLLFLSVIVCGCTDIVSQKDANRDSFDHCHEAFLNEYSKCMYMLGSVNRDSINYYKGRMDATYELESYFLKQSEKK